MSKKKKKYGRCAAGLSKQCIFYGRNAAGLSKVYVFMVGALHVALKNDVASQGSFDLLVVEQATTSFSKAAAELAQALV